MISEPSCASMLDELCTKQIKQKETNEVMSMKMHYLAHLLRTARQAIYGKQGEEKDEAAVRKGLETLIKTFLKGCPEMDGFPIFMEKYLRQVIREFPYHQSALLQQMVHGLSKTEIGNTPTALDVMMQCLFGQHAMQSDTNKCYTCGSLNAQKRCGACKYATYCDVECQKLHWFTHKSVCKLLLKKRLEMKRFQQENPVTEDMENIPPDCMAAMDMAHMDNIKCPMSAPGQEPGAQDVVSNKSGDGGKCPHSGHSDTGGGEVTEEVDEVTEVVTPTSQENKCPVSGHNKSEAKTRDIPAACPFSGKGVDGKKLSELLDSRVEENRSRVGSSKPNGGTQAENNSIDTTDIHLDMSGN